MNPYYEPELSAEERPRCADTERAFFALEAIYREAGLSAEHARLSAAADCEDYFGCFTTCAA
jgi:hypothetical protein